MDSEGKETDDRLAKGYKRAAWAFWLTPAIMLSPLLLPLLNPSSRWDAITDGWEVYLLFFGIPWALGTAFWLHSRRVERHG